MINRTSYLNFSCRCHAVVGHLRAAACEAPKLPLRSIGKGIKRLSGEHHDSGFLIDNARTMRHLGRLERLNTHSPRLHIANRHRLRGFLL